MLSMTGYGSGAAQAEGFSARVDLRVVNNKQVDVRMRGNGVSNQGLSNLETSCRDSLVRGRVELSFQVERTSQSESDIIDPVRAKHAWQVLNNLSQDLGTPAPTLETLLRIPNLLATQPTEPDQEAKDSAVLSALRNAIDATQQMRLQEGSALAQDMRERLDKITRHVAVIESATPNMIDHFRDKLRERVESLLLDAREINDERLEREVVMFAARADITEETVRLTSHLQQLSPLFASDDPVGKRIDFLLQEVSREVNTIASKVSDAGIAQVVVEIKSEVSRLREQALNIL